MPVQMVLDTGSMVTMLTPAAVARLNLATDPLRTTTINAIGGEITTHNTSVQSLRIGNNDWMWSSLPTGRLPTEYDEDPPVVGQLGADRLSEFDVELDLPRERMALWRVENCDGDFVPWQMPHLALQLARYSPRRMVTPVTLDGHPLTAQIAWGARSSMLTTGGAMKAGVTSAMLAQDHSSFSHGADQNQIPVAHHRFAELSIGPMRYHNITLGVAPLQVLDVDMLLGIEFIARRHVWLSYASDQLFMQRGLDAGP